MYNNSSLPPHTHTHTHTQQLESTVESLKASLQEKEDKYTKMVKTLKAARSRIDTLKTDKDQVHVHVHVMV